MSRGHPNQETLWVSGLDATSKQGVRDRPPAVGNPARGHTRRPLTSPRAGCGPGLLLGPERRRVPPRPALGPEPAQDKDDARLRRPSNSGGGWGQATGQAGPAAYRGRSAGDSGPGASLGLPPRRRYKGGQELRRSPSSGSSGLLGTPQAFNAAAAAALGFMAKTPAPLPLPPPPPPRAEVPVTRLSTPRVRGRSPASILRHVPAASGPSLDHVAYTCLPPIGCCHL